MKYISVLFIVIFTIPLFSFDYRVELDKIGEIISECEKGGKCFGGDERLRITFLEFKDLFKELESIMPERERGMTDEDKKSAIEYINKDLLQGYEMAIASIKADFGEGFDGLNDILYMGATYSVNEEKALGNAALEISSKFVFQKDSSLVILNIEMARLDDKLFVVRIGRARVLR